MRSGRVALGWNDFTVCVPGVVLRGVVVGAVVRRGGVLPFGFPVVVVVEPGTVGLVNAVNGSSTVFSFLPSALSRASRGCVIWRWSDTQRTGRITPTATARFVLPSGR